MVRVFVGYLLGPEDWVGQTWHSARLSGPPKRRHYIRNSTSNDTGRSMRNYGNIWQWIINLSLCANPCGGALT